MTRYETANRLGDMRTHTSQNSLRIFSGAALGVGVLLVAGILKQKEVQHEKEVFDPGLCADNCRYRLYHL